MSARLARAVAAALIAACLLTACAMVSDAGTATRPVVGSCHVLTQQQEFAAQSDSRPAAGCRSAHTSETFLVGAVPAPFSKLHRRPDAAAQAQIAGQVCASTALDAYLGAGPYDGLYGVWSVSFLPTAAAWSKGARWIRCDAVQTSQDDALRPEIRHTTLRGALHGDRADRLLRCYRQARSGGTLASTHVRQVSCDQPHTSRDVNDWTQTSIPPVPTDYLGTCSAVVSAWRKDAAAPAQATVVVIPSGVGSGWSVRCAAVDS